MLHRVDFKSGRPVHLQVMDQIKGAAASGALRPGEALPSIGPLAEELRVNRNSVARAYSELERLGVIEMHPGRGYFLKGDYAGANGWGELAEAGGSRTHRRRGEPASRCCGSRELTGLFPIAHRHTPDIRENPD